jgi:hypothetical protein
MSTPTIQYNGERIIRERERQAITGLSRHQWYRRTGVLLLPEEFERAKEAAGRRRMAFSRFLREAIIVTTDSTLRAPEHELDPFERRKVSSYVLSRR